MKNVELRDYQKKILDDLRYVPSIGLFMKTGCVDRDTEYFDGKEWKKICDYIDGEKVLQFDKFENKAILDYPLEYIKQEEDTLYLIKTKYGVNQCLSKEHNMLFYNKHTDKPFDIQFTDFIKKHTELKQGFYHKILTTFNYSGIGIDLKDDEIRLMLAVICDGTFANKTNNCVINLKKKRKIIELESILKSLNIKYSKNIKKNGFTYFRFKAPRREKEFTTYWYNCNSEQLKLIANNICKWDGSYSSGRQSFSNTSKSTIDFIQFAFASVGKRASISVDNRLNDIHKSICYRLNITNRNKVGIGNSSTSKKTEIIHYNTKDGYKYCFRTRTGYLILRRCGKIFITGNSGKTITSLARFEENDTDNLLVICPQKVVSQWWEEIEKYTDLKPIKYGISLSSTKKWKIMEEYLKSKTKNKCIVVNFDIICKLDLVKYIDNNWTIIIDESHKIKSVGTSRKPVQITNYCLELGCKTDYKIILTATPTEKEQGGYIDYYSQLRFLGYIDYNITYFKNKYCIMEKLQYPGMPFPITKIKEYRMDKIKEDFLPILQATCRYYAPKYGDYEPQHIKVSIDICNSYPKLLRERAYRDITFDNVSALRIGKKTLTSGAITGTDEYYDRYIYKDNDKKISWVKEFLENTDDKVAILYNYNVELALLQELCESLGKKYIIINGSIKDKPAELKKDFDVILGQYEAFSESLDGLQYKCHLMVFYSMPDSSRAYKQSLGRIDRIGQEEVPTYYYLIMKGTIDEAIYRLLLSKVEFSERDLNKLDI